MNPVASQVPVFPTAHGALGVLLGAVKGEAMIPTDCMISAALRPNMMRL